MRFVKTVPFVHLHVHTGYSLLDGATRLDDLISTCAEYGMPAVAKTDHGVMYGSIEFYKEAREAGVKPIFGFESYITPGSRHDRKGEGARVPINHLVLLAETLEGYENLCRLASLAQLEGFYYKPRIDREILRKYHKGLIGLSACLKGDVAQCLMNNDMPGAERSALEYQDIFGKGNFFLEVQDHKLPEQRQINPHLLTLSQKTGIQLVATNDIHYLKREHADAHEVLLCLQTQSLMSDPNRMRYRTKEFYLKTGLEMQELFRDFPGAVEITVEIAERCNVELDFKTAHFPQYTIPGGLTSKEYLIKLGHEGLLNRYGIKKPSAPVDDKEKQIVERFNYELGVIEKTGFVNYFLVVWDFVRYSHEAGIPVGPGRGSGGGSVVAYCLGITGFDPLLYDLIFERFLNPERVSAPDFDIDFCQARRGEVIEYVRTKYGRENTAQIITFGSLGAKTVIRDVGRVLEVDFKYCDRLAKMIPETPKITLKDALQQNPEFKKAYDAEPDCKRILDYAFVLEGLQRNQGTHAAGVVIGEKPLIEIIPLSRDKNGEVVTQYAMEPLGQIGLLKMDFLGLKTLTVIREALVLIKEIHGKDINIDTLSLDDKPTYELLNRGDTIGVFQLESDGMRDLSRRVKIDSLHDLMAMIALYRPGPMKMLDTYVNRKHGKEKVRYLHPLMESVLKETYGIAVYQEQVQKLANVLAGYSLGLADVLRRAMSKKKPSEMAKQREIFISGCAKHNHIKKESANAIFDAMADFADYGFNKSHSAGYAIISYQTAYLKSNYPAEFMAALVSSEMGNPDKMPGFIAEAQAMGLEILPPDINLSTSRFHPSEKGIRFGLAGIKNVGEGAADSIVKERKANGPYKDLVDFCIRLGSQNVNRKVIESLVRAGSFDSFGLHRARAFNGIDVAMASANRVIDDRRTGQTSLFGMFGDSSPTSSLVLPDCKPWHETELLSGERELLGTYMSGHPLTQFTYLIKHYQLHSIKQLQELENNTMTRLGGVISEVEKKTTKDKRAMAVMSMEDIDDPIEVLVFPETYQTFGMHLVKNSAVLVCGTVDKRDVSPKIVAQEIYPLSDAPRHFATRLNIHISMAHAQTDILDKVKQTLLLHPGTTIVSICLISPNGEKVFMDAGSNLRVFPGETLHKELEHILGEKSVFVSINTNPCKIEHKSRFQQRNGNGNGQNRNP